MLKLSHSLRTGNIFHPEQKTLVVFFNINVEGNSQFLVLHFQQVKLLIKQLLKIISLWMNAVKNIFSPTVDVGIARVRAAAALEGGWRGEGALPGCTEVTHRQGGGAGQAAADETLVGRAGAPPFGGAVGHQSPAESSLGGFGERKGSCDLRRLARG